MIVARPHRSLVALAATAAALVLLAGAQSASAGPHGKFAGATIENPSRVPPFTLRDETGRTVSLAAARGRAVLLTFLYTECKDVCPLTAGNLNEALRRLGPQRQDVQVLAVSVDPEGDTRGAVQRFVRQHRLLPQFHYLIGSKAQLAPVWQAYNVVSIRRARGDVDHTLYTVLLDRRGRARVLYDATALPGEFAHDVRLVLRER